MDTRFWIRIEGAKQGLMNKEIHVGSDGSPAGAGGAQGGGGAGATPAPTGGATPTPAHMRGLDFAYEVGARVGTTGIPGKRVHQPVRITKEWSPSTPQLFGALTTNEPLKSVRLEFIRELDDTIYQTIELTNARVIAARWYIADGLELEDVSFVFEKIAVQNLPGATSAQDVWNAA